MFARSWVGSSTCGTSGGKVRSAACLGTITKPLQPIVGTSVRLCAKIPELFPTSCSSALADRKSNLNRARAPTSSVRSSGPLREPWTDDGTKLEKRCTLPNRDICRGDDACRVATRLVYSNRIDYVVYYIDTESFFERNTAAKICLLHITLISSCGLVPLQI